MDIQLDENARTIFDKRYSRKDEEGNPTEEPMEAVRRVAENVAVVNALYLHPRHDHGGGYPEVDISTIDITQPPYSSAQRQYGWMRRNDRDVGTPEILMARTEWRERAEQYVKLLSGADYEGKPLFFPNSPTWTGAGTPLNQLAACFVLPVEDDLGTSRGSIFETMRVAALIQQTGGGNGFSGSRLRPHRALVRRSMGQASGPVNFLKGCFDPAFGTIAQGGSRRGANMFVLVVHHPDIEDFIVLKLEEGVVENFNVSVAITDEFMDAVAKDEFFDLRWSPTDGAATDDPGAAEVYRTIKARDLYDRIIRAAWTRGEPGNLFIDRANRDNPCPTRYVLEATNPCGEQWLPPYSNCCLGSIAVERFAHWAYGPDEEGKGCPAWFDWDGFAETVMTSAQFLDDVVDANGYVAAVPELEVAAMGERRIGLGLMGLADAMAKMGIRYGSPDGLDFASQVTEFARFYAMKASIHRARERGSFEWIKESIYDPSLHRTWGAGGEVAAILGLDGNPLRLWARPKPLVEHRIELHRPKIDWGEIEEGVSAYGIRNACQFTFAPTGTISNVSMLEGSGLECFFALMYERHVMQEGENLVLQYVSPLFKEALRQAGIEEGSATYVTIFEKVVRQGGSCQGIFEVPEHIQHAFVVSADLTPEEHVWMQAACQAWVDNSISKTVNFPLDATIEDVGKAFRLAYDLGCKGITVYRQGSREKEVLRAVKTDAGEVQVEEETWPILKPMPIPEYVQVDGLPTTTFEIKTPFGHLQCYITELKEHPGRPYDIRLQLGKAGNDKTADIEAIGRMASVALRSGVSVAVIADQLEGIGGATIGGFGPNKVKSAGDAVGKLLRRLYLPETTSVESEVGRSMQVDATAVCPNCHNATLVFDAGCYHCEPKLGGCGDFNKCD